MSNGAAEASQEPDKNGGKSEQEALPPLSDHDFRAYNRLAEKMEYFVRTRIVLYVALSHLI